LAQDQAEALKCPRCGAAMEYASDKHFYWCSACGVKTASGWKYLEVWPPEDAPAKQDSEEKQFRERRFIHSRYGGEINPPVPIIDPKSRGSNNSHKRKRKKSIKPWYQRDRTI